MRRRLGSDYRPGQSLPRNTVDDLVQEVIHGDEHVAGVPAKPAELRDTFTDKHQIFIQLADGWRLSERGEMLNKAMFSGLEILQAPSDAHALHRFAHNHLLLYPETFPLLRAFAPPGSEKSALDRWAGHFFFSRKVNSVTIDYIAWELEHLQIVRKGQGFELFRPAPAVIAYNFVDAYLQASDMRLDYGVPIQDIVTQLNMYFREARRYLLSPDWQRDLRPSGGPLMKREMGDSQLRLERADFLWLTEHSLVEPSLVGRVLREMKSFAALQALREKLEPILIKNTPINEHDYLSALSPDENELSR
ncbi:hypothetical protein [Hyalangium minutum]|nr:hypothetical protein [Hyalangium minutum]